MFKTDSKLNRIYEDTTAVDNKCLNGGPYPISQEVEEHNNKLN